MTSAGSSTKGNETILYLEIDDGNGVKTFKYFEKVTGSWNEIDEKGFNEKMKTMGEAVKSSEDTQEDFTGLSELPETASDTAEPKETQSANSQ